MAAYSQAHFDWSKAALTLARFVSGNPGSCGLTGTSRQLYSAGFASFARAARRDKPLWRNW
jgi:hypothetical protein